MVSYNRCVACCIQEGAILLNLSVMSMLLFITDVIKVGIHWQVIMSSSFRSRLVSKICCVRHNADKLMLKMIYL